MRIDATPPTRRVLSRRFSRRTLLSAAGLGGLSAALAACSSDDGNGGNGSGNGSAAATIRWWHIQDFDPLQSRWAEIVQDFEAANSGTSLDVTPLNNDDWDERLAPTLSADDPPDLFQSWGGGEMADQIEAGLIQDITDGVEPVLGNFYEHALAPYTVDGRVYGLSFNMGMVGFWYNQELFDQAGITEVPTTWPDFLEVVQMLKAADIVPIALGGEVQWPGHYYWAYLAMRMASVEGLQAAAAEGSLDAPEFVRAGELLQELVELEPFQPGFLSGSYDLEDGQAALVGTGQAAMELMGQWAPVVQADASGTENGIGDDLNFFPFPAVEEGDGAITEVMGGGDGIVVGRDAPEEVFEFLNHFYDVDTYRDTVATQGVLSVMPDTDDQVEDPRLQQVLEVLGGQTAFQLYLDRDFPTAVGQEINAASAALFAGEMSPEDVVQAVTEVWQREG